jgi:multidrug efflux pump subunit AcrA (membrane-fusion protein)
MFASVRIGDTVKRTVATVPSSAILSRGPDSFVLLEESAGRFRRRRVKAGRELEGYTAVEQGLEAGDRVVTSGVLLLDSEMGEK